MRVSDNTAISMPMRNLLSILAAVAIGVWAYFGIIEKQNKISTTLELMEKDLVENTAFRIGWPRGTLGSLPRRFRAIYADRGIIQTSRKITGTTRVWYA